MGYHPASAKISANSSGDAGSTTLEPYAGCFPRDGPAFELVSSVNKYLAAPAERLALAWVLGIQESDPLLDPEGLSVWVGETDM